MLSPVHAAVAAANETNPARIGREWLPRPVRGPSTFRAVLALAAMVASVLAAGAAPAAAVTDRADHTTLLSACVGDATTDRMFTDVSEGHVFRAAINCIAYYGITKGTGDGTTYSPNQDVTRAQMAVFVARAAEAAGVDLGDARDAGFGDIGDTWGEAQDAINRLASKRMIPLSGAFRPDDAITRAEMATFLIGLLVKAAPDVTIDSSGLILVGTGGSISLADDWFADARAALPPANDAEISAIYELGVTKGSTPAAVQDDTKPPLDVNYEPHATVTRGAMAAFITRALAHTSVRPAGVSAQFDGADVIVSVRDAQFKPVSRAVVDVFWTTTDQADRALLTDGTCHRPVVTQADRSFFPCEIDDTDPITGSDGESRMAVTGLRRVPAGGATVWAWTGKIGDTLEAGADLYTFDVPEGADLGFASTTLVTTSFTARKVRFGSSVLYSLQLRDIVGNVSTGVDGIDPARWNLSVQVTGEDPDVQTLVSDPTGEAAFSIRLNDPNPGTVGDELTATYTLAAAVNAPPGGATVDANGHLAATGTLTFSDEASSISPGSATVIIDTRGYVHVSGAITSNSVTVTVLDQYGTPFPGAKVRLDSTLSGVTPGGGAEFTVDGRGSHGFSYRYSGQDGETETLSAYYGSDSAATVGETATVYWAADAGATDDGAILAGDVRRRQVVVDDGDGPVILVYDDNDRFNLGGEATSMAVFEAELAAALRRESPSLELAWSNYRAGSDRRVTEYTLS